MQCVARESDWYRKDALLVVRITGVARVCRSKTGFDLSSSSSSSSFFSMRSHLTPNIFMSYYITKEEERELMNQDENRNYDDGEGEGGGGDRDFKPSKDIETYLFRRSFIS